METFSKFSYSYIYKLNNDVDRFSPDLYIHIRHYICVYRISIKYNFPCCSACFFFFLLSNHKKLHYCNGYFNLPFLCSFSLRKILFYLHLYMFILSANTYLCVPIFVIYLYVFVFVYLNLVLVQHGFLLKHLFFFYFYSR